MALSITIQRADGYVVGALSGAATAADITDAIGTLAHYTRQHGDTRVLADLLGIEGTLAFTEHFQLGQQVAVQLKHLDKLASVVPADKITRTSEKVAVSLGVELRVFTGLDEARAWLSA